MAPENRDLISIGKFAELAHLSVSALRFYDDCNLLAPERVDPATGYRFYTVEQLVIAQLVRTLRALEMPVAAIRQLLALPPGERAAALEQHWQKMEERLLRARGSLEDARKTIKTLEVRVTTHTWTVSGSELAGAFRQVAPYAAQPDGAGAMHPKLAALLVEGREGTLRIVATDSHRLAIREISARGTGAPAQAVLPLDQVRRLAEALRNEGDVSLDVEEGRLSVELPSGRVEVQTEGDAYPNYEVVLASSDTPRHRALVSLSDLRAALAGRTEDHVVLEFGAQQRLRAAGDVEFILPGEYTGPGMIVAFNPKYLATGINDMVGPDVLIESEGPASATTLRSADSGTFTTVVMPVGLGLRGLTETSASFTQATWRAIQAARTAADAAGRRGAGVEDLLPALVSAPDSAAKKLLQELGLKSDALIGLLLGGGKESDRQRSLGVVAYATLDVLNEPGKIGTDRWLVSLLRAERKHAAAHAESTRWPGIDLDAARPARARIRGEGLE
ncbi:MAG: MerR family transcriptional regulator [Candidatus Dormibacteria bacterium]